MLLCYFLAQRDLSCRHRAGPRSRIDIKLVTLTLIHMFLPSPNSTCLDYGSRTDRHTQTRMSAGPGNELFGSMGTQSHASNAFQQLAQGLNYHLESSPGSAFKDINHQPIIQAMEGYKSRSSEWDKYAHKNAKQCFTRNLVDPGNGKHNLVCRVSAQEAEHEFNRAVKAHPRLEPRQGKPHSRPCWVTLYHESTTTPLSSSAER